MRSWLAAFALLALVAYNAVVYLKAPGSVWESLTAAWQGSMTICALIWTGFVSALMNGMDAVSSITGHPRFAEVGAAPKAAVPADYSQWIVIGTRLLPIVAGVVTGQRTLRGQGG